MIDIEPKEMPVAQIQAYLLGGVAPRPIALVSTVSADGANNLSPFSFFNTFGANPPTVAFSPSRRQRDGSVKDTYNNLVAIGECVVQAVTYDMVQQVSLASTEYGPEVDEFIKSGLTPVDSQIVKPKRVQQSPFQMECRVKQILPLGDGPGSGNLVICEVVMFHVSEDVFADGVIEPDLIDLVGRNSKDYYTRAKGGAIFEVAKPIRKKGMGYDQLPPEIRNSSVLTANNIAQLANCEKIPDAKDSLALVDGLEKAEASLEQFEAYELEKDYRRMLATALALRKSGHADAAELIERTAQAALDRNDTDFAWKVLVLLSQTVKR